MARSPTGARIRFGSARCAASPASSALFSRPARSSSSSRAAVLAAVVWKYEQDLPDYTQLKNYEPPVMTRVHAADGSLLAEYSRERRLYLPSSAIPDLVKQAFISAEDKNFYSHGGVRSRGHRARRPRLPAGLTPRPGRLDHHPAGGEELPAELRPHVRPQDPRDPAQRRASSPPIRRKRSSSSTSTKSISACRNYGVAAAALNYFDKSVHELTDRGGRLSRGAAQGAERAQSVPQSRPRHRAAQLRDRPHGRRTATSRPIRRRRRARPSRSASIRAC